MCRSLIETQLGMNIGVSQKRIARIEADPAKVSFDRVSKLIILLGGDLVAVGKSSDAASKPSSKSTSKLGDNW